MTDPYEVPPAYGTDANAETTDFLTCRIECCRPGISNALKAALREILAGKLTIAGVIAPRYGKSHLMRQLAIELIERDFVGVCIMLAPWKFLRDQLNSDDKIKDMIKHHNISNAVIRPKPIVPDILSGKIDPEFYKATPLRHWWGLTMAQASAEETRKVLRDVAATFRHEKRPMVVFIDESQYTSIGDYGWGKLAAELKTNGAILILLTGTPERADNVAPFGFKTKEVSRHDLQYKTMTRINDDEIQLDFYDAQKVRYRLISDIPQVGLSQAWKEEALAKLQHRFFTFKSDKTLVDKVENRKARRALGEALRDTETIRVAVRLMLDELRLRRQTDGVHGASAPQTAAIAFVGNDRYDDDGNDWHAREVKRIIIQEWPDFFSSKKPKTQITTSQEVDNDSDKAAEAIKDFVDGDGDVIIVKQMGGVGLDAARLKVGLDLSTIRTKSSTTQRWLRIATPLEGIANGTMIIPNDPITKQLWKDIVTEQGGQYTIENATLVSSKVVAANPKPNPKPVISDPQRAGSIDQSLRPVENDLDQKLDAILVKSPIFAVRFTRRELADEYEKGLFNDIKFDTTADESPAPTVAVFDVTSEIEKKQTSIKQHCTELANQVATYIKAGKPGHNPVDNEKWINHWRRRMSQAKSYAGIRGDVMACRDLDKLKNAEGWLEGQLDRT